MGPSSTPSKPKNGAGMGRCTLDSLGCRDRRPVRRNDLWLVAKHLAAARIDRDLEPVHVIVAIGLIVAKGFHPG